MKFLVMLKVIEIRNLNFYQKEKNPHNKKMWKWTCQKTIQFVRNSNKKIRPWQV